MNIGSEIQKRIRAMPEETCRECGIEAVATGNSAFAILARKRGLCSVCYRDPDIRAKYVRTRGRS